MLCLGSTNFLAKIGSLTSPIPGIGKMTSQVTFTPENLLAEYALRFIGHGQHKERQNLYLEERNIFLPKPLVLLITKNMDSWTTSNEVQNIQHPYYYYYLTKFLNKTYVFVQ